MEKKLIGKLETISLPLLNIFDIDAKIDTGAFSCSIHCKEIVVDKEKNSVSFKLLDPSHEAYHGKLITLPLCKSTKVKSSNGEVQKRAFIKTKVRFYGKYYIAVISLTDRSKMQYPMLIGRDFLKNRFIVDVSKSYLSKEKE